jgi:hypothetical protein
VIELLERALTDARAGSIGGVLLVEFGASVTAKLVGEFSLGDLALGRSFADRLVEAQIDKAESLRAEDDSEG